MHFPLGHLWRVILYHAKNCELLSQQEFGWAGVCMGCGGRTAADAESPGGHHVDSISLSC